MLWVANGGYDSGGGSREVGFHQAEANACMFRQKEKLFRFEAD